MRRQVGQFVSEQSMPGRSHLTRVKELSEARRPDALMQISSSFPPRWNKTGRRRRTYIIG